MIANKKKTCCGGGPITWLRNLSLADGREVSVIGLDMIFSALAREQRAPDKETAAEILRQLSRKNNITPALAPLYEDAALKEYEAFLVCTIEKKTTCAPESGPGLFTRFFQIMKSK
ncbi:MAG TPA: hypothetical protein VGJ94_02605 [Syntrophorhabdaceae bacterium]|jgi:hypothetical protein